MIQRILVKDMKRRKSVNLILFLFITMATIFLASSVNNILVVMSSVDYYMDYAKVPDISFFTAGDTEQEQIINWLEERTEIDDFGYNFLFSLEQRDVTILKENQEVSFITDGISIYLGTIQVEYCKVFDSDGNEVTLEDNEVALSQYMLDKNHLQVGDTLIIQVGDIKKELKIKTGLKDAAFGNSFVGINRILINQFNLKQYVEHNSNDILYLYYANINKQLDFAKELNLQGFKTVVQTIPKDTYTMVYAFDLIMAALLILIGICLILIALLVLRFTLVFTVEEDYREIGVMKAIGIRDFSIKKIYLIKYFVLVITGSFLGLVLSIPISSQMVSGVNKNMIMKDSSANFGINILCTFFIILVVLFFCYHCTARLNKISPIVAIRGGATGERFERDSLIMLHKCKRLPVVMYLALNDIFKNVKKYFVMLITFLVSFILITIPLNTLNTMQSKEMAKKFAIDPNSAVYVNGLKHKNTEELKEQMRLLEEKLKQKGYDVQLTAIPFYFLPYGEQDQTLGNKILTSQLLGPNQNYLVYQEGIAPVLENEIAFSQKALKENGWKIGDTIETYINGEKKSFLITGAYSDYMQLGISARINPVVDLGKEFLFDYWNIMLDMKTDKTQKELKDELELQFPEYEWSTTQEFMDRNLGGIQQSLQNLLHPMTGMLCAVIMLITWLMERLFVVREKGEIAMMKSIGFCNKTIRLWQVLRMVWVAVLSMIIAIPLSLVSNRWMLKPIFAIMGADVEIQVIPWQVYGVYPGVLLFGIILATYFAAGKVKKINIQELNCLE